MRLRKLARVCLCIIAAVVIAGAAFILFIPDMSALGPAIDYRQSIGSEEELLIRIADRLHMELPSSASDPQMYRGAGIDDNHWMAFRINPSDVDDWCTSLGKEASLDSLPCSEPPEAIRSWWMPDGKQVSVWGWTLELRAGTWVMVARETGEVWAYSFRN